MKTLSENKRIILNIIMSITATATTALIGFFLSPYIVRTIGVEAQGFVQLALNFTAYVGLVTVAINSMAGRFITIAVSKGDQKEAEKYYSSIFYGNIIIVAALLIPISLCILYLERLIDIPLALVNDVKLLFLFVFANFFTVTLLSLWNNTFFVTNRPYLQSTGNVISTMIQALSVFILFSLLPPKIYYSSFSVIIASIFTVFWSLTYKKRLLPSLKVKKSSVSLAHIMEVVSSGIWRTVQSVGELLLSGLDLLICNLFLNSVVMGILALSKSLPTMLAGFCWQLATTFAPQLTINYAKGDNKALLPELRKACRISAIIGTVPIAGLIVFCDVFYRLWVPDQDSSVLQILSILTCAGMLFAAGTQPIANIFAAVNKVKPQAISVIISGIVNIIIVAICLRFTNIGVYAIAGTSTAILILRHVAYALPTAARYLGFKWHTFIFGIAYSLLGSLIVMVIGYAVKYAVKPDSWALLVLSCAITGILGFAFNTLIICNRIEKQQMASWVIRKFGIVGRSK